MEGTGGGGEKGWNVDWCSCEGANGKLILQRMQHRRSLTLRIDDARSITRHYANGNGNRVRDEQVRIEGEVLPCGGRSTAVAPFVIDHPD